MDFWLDRGGAQYHARNPFGNESIATRPASALKHIDIPSAWLVAA